MKKAKMNVYVIEKEGKVMLAKTLKSVEEATGVKYSKKDVEEGIALGVTAQEVELAEEQEDILRNGILELSNEEVWNSGIAVTGVMDFENIEGDMDMKDVKDLVEVEEVLEEVEELEEEEEELEEVEELEEEEEELEEVEELEEEVEGSEEVPTATVEPSMDDLLAKLQANNEKIAKENPEKVKNKRGKAVELVIDDNGDVVYPEKGYFKEEDDIKKYYKQLDNKQLDEWLELEGLEYTPNEHAGIDRMRKCMAIKDYHFPRQTKAKKSRSKYADFTTEDLLEMALENDVEVKDAKGDLRILRMYTIVALREAGIIE